MSARGTDMDPDATDPLSTTLSLSASGRTQRVSSRWAAAGAILFLGLVLSESSTSTVGRIAWMAVTTLCLGWWTSPRTSTASRTAGALSWSSVVPAAKLIWSSGLIPESEWKILLFALSVGIVGAIAGVARDLVSVPSVGATRRLIAAGMWFTAATASVVVAVYGTSILSSVAEATFSDGALPVLVLAACLISAAAGGLLIGIAADVMDSRLYGAFD